MSLAEYAAQNGLTRVGARPPLRSYLREVWRRRQFIYSLSRFRIESDNHRNRLGMAWVIIKPLLNALVYGTIFGILLKGSRPGNFVAFLVVGIFFFEFFSTSFARGAKSITTNNALVQSLSFPRMALPLAAVLQRFLQFLPTLPILFIIVVITGERPTFQWFLLVPLCFLYFVFNAGLSLITARLTVHFRDLGELLPFITRLLFYTSGIFFSFEKRFGEHKTLMKFIDLQPIHEFMDLARSILITGQDYTMNMSYWLYAIVWSLAVLVFGVVFFWAAEERYGRTD